MAAASTTWGWATSTDSTSAGPRRLPATLIVSSERPRIYQSPSESLAAQSPCTQTFGQRDQYVSSYRVGSFQKPRVMPIQGALITSSPTSLVTDCPCSLNMSAAIPGQGPEKAVAFSGKIGLPITMPPEISVP